MDPAQVVCSAVYDAVSLARQAAFVARSEQNKIKIRLSGLEARAGKAIEVAADARAMHKLASRVLWIPIVRGQVLRKNAQMVETETVRLTETNSEISRLKVRVGVLQEAIKAAEKSGRLLGKAALAAEQLGMPPKRIEDTAANLKFQIRFLAEARPNLHWVSQVAETSRAVIELIKLWAQTKASQPTQKLLRPGVSKPAIGGPERKIYLPIPSALGPEARELGARSENDGLRGVSSWYVTTNQDLQPFRNLLPIAYRQEVTKFEFPPIPYRASGQNLWGFFDRSTWDRVRKTSYSMTGHRCAVCGGRGGFIADKVLGEEERRHGVECHEVWDWQVEDQSTGVGVQKLQRLLVLCASCHAVFHAGHFAIKARDRGLEDEVRAFIEKRRMLINRVGLDELNADLQATKDAMMQAKGIDKWIIDLESLSNQQFMADHLPVMRERNDANVSAGRIAGIAFETDAGERFPRRSANDIYNELVEADLEMNQSLPGLR